MTVACSVACSSSLNKGTHTAIYIVLVHTAIKDLDSDLDLELLDLDSESCSFHRPGLVLEASGLDFTLAVAGLDTSLSVSLTSVALTSRSFSSSLDEKYSKIPTQQ